MHILSKPSGGFEDRLNPPTVLASVQRLCSRNGSSSCALMAETNVQDTINSPDFPTGGEVYQA
jgi:hypothetical protein